MMNEGYSFIFTTPVGPRLPRPGHRMLTRPPRSTCWPTGSGISLGRERPKSYEPGQCRQRAAQVPTGPSCAASLSPRADRPHRSPGDPAAVTPADLGRQPCSRSRSSGCRVPDQRPMAPGYGRRELQRRPRQDPGAGGRERLGQDGLGAGRDGARSSAPGLPGRAVFRHDSRGRDLVFTPAWPRPTSVRSGATTSP